MINGNFKSAHSGYKWKEVTSLKLRNSSKRVSLLFLSIPYFPEVIWYCKEWSLLTVIVSKVPISGQAESLGEKQTPYWGCKLSWRFYLIPMLEDKDSSRFLTEYHMNSCLFLHLWLFWKSKNLLIYIFQREMKSSNRDISTYFSLEISINIL